MSNLLRTASLRGYRERIITRSYFASCGNGRLEIFRGDFFAIEFATIYTRDLLPKYCLFTSGRTDPDYRDVTGLYRHVRERFISFFFNFNSPHVASGRIKVQMKDVYLTSLCLSKFSLFSFTLPPQSVTSCCHGDTLSVRLTFTHDTRLRTFGVSWCLVPRYLCEATSGPKSSPKKSTTPNECITCTLQTCSLNFPVIG